MEGRICPPYESTGVDRGTVAPGCRKARACRWAYHYPLIEDRLKCPGFVDSQHEENNMKHAARLLLISFLSCAAMNVAAADAAGDYPNRPIRVITAVFGRWPPHPPS